ncbi:MAG: toll/interleukin-1 receptor domain-containing protein [Dehalococcoidia bacterium]|nr:toll/interleukin-1 receptor domain-containing protein [Dehalococcoidia bacterium]
MKDPSVGPERVFISYETATGLDLATAIRHELDKLGIRGWVWAIDHPSGYVFAEIANRIMEADYICWLCTEGTPASNGQKWEIENAFGQNKAERSWVMTTARRYVPVVLSGYFAFDVSLSTADVAVGDWVARARAGFPTWPALSNEQASITPEASRVLEALPLSNTP